MKHLLILAFVLLAAIGHAQDRQKVTLYHPNGFDVGNVNPLPVTIPGGFTVTTSGATVLTGTTEAETGILITTGSLVIAAGAKYIELAPTLSATATVFLTSGTLVITGAEYGVWVRRPAAGDTLEAYTILWTSGTFRGGQLR